VDLHKELYISKTSKNSTIQKDGEAIPMAKFPSVYGVTSGARSLQDGKTFGVGLIECKSKKDLAEMLKQNIKPDKILFSAPCKMQSHIKYAGENNVKFFTFDNAVEMMKIKKIVPDAKLLLSLEDNSTEEMAFKFGVAINEVENLLQEAKENQINVVGVYLPNNNCWFHKDIAGVKQALEIGNKIGLKLTQLHLRLEEIDIEKLRDMQQILVGDIEIFVTQAEKLVIAESRKDEKTLAEPVTTYCKLEAALNAPIIPRLVAPHA